MIDNQSFTDFPFKIYRFYRKITMRNDALLIILTEQKRVPYLL